MPRKRRVIREDGPADESYRSISGFMTARNTVWSRPSRLRFDSHQTAPFFTLEVNRGQTTV